MKAQIKPLTVGAGNGSQVGNQSTYSTVTSNSQQQKAKSELSESHINSKLREVWARVLKHQSLRTRLLNTPQTDAGNGECFVFLHQDSLRFCRSIGKWLKWNGNKWVIDAEGEAHVAAIVTARVRNLLSSSVTDDNARSKLKEWGKASESITRRNATLKTAMHMKPLEMTIDEFDQNPFLVAGENGTLDLEKGEFRESRREDYITKQFNVAFDPLANAHRWEKFLDEIFAGDEELISFVQRAVGYSLTGDTREQVIFILFGNGANGKSVFVDVLTHLLGDYAVNTPFSTFEANRRNEATNDLARLKGARFVSSIETNEDRRLEEARVKSVTGQDEISARFLYQEFFSYRPTFKIWMAVNHKPLIRGTDRGIWRRIRLIPFTQNFEGRADKDLISKLKVELPGILNWALEGLQNWKQRGLGTAKAIDVASEEYRVECDLLEQWLDEEVILEGDEKESCNEAYNSFRNWCSERGFPKLSFNSFARLMTEKGFARKSDGKRRHYVGLKLLGPPSD